MYCPKCGSEILEGNRFCVHCGTQISEATATCRSCGAEASPGLKYCGQCGQNLTRAPGTEKKHVWTAVAIVSIWLAVLFASIFAPDMITGSEREHLPIAAATSWFWGLIATGFVLALARGSSGGMAHTWIAVATVGVWLAVLLTSIFAPELETGSDPTIIPLAAILSPMIGAIATGFLWAFGKGS